MKAFTRATLIAITTTALAGLTCACGKSDPKGAAPAAEPDPTVYGGGDTNSKAAMEDLVDTEPAKGNPK